MPTKTKIACIIPLSDITKMSIYVNRDKKTMEQIKKETGCDYIINGTIYNMSAFTPCADLKVDGEVLYRSGYTEYGFMWDEGSDLEFGIIPTNATNKKNYISCKGIVVNDDIQIYNMGDLDGKRGRTAMAFFYDSIYKRNSLLLYVTKDGTYDASRPEELAEELKTLGCRNVLMLDGGGSSQGSFKDDNIITSSRIVHHYVLVYTHPIIEEPINIENPHTAIDFTSLMSQVKWALVNRYGANPNNEYTEQLKAFQKDNGLEETALLDATTLGILYSDNMVHNAVCPYANYRSTSTIEMGHVTTSVKWLQWHLITKHGYHLEINGRFKEPEKIAVQRVQEKYGLAPTGIADPATQRYIERPE